MHHAPRGCLIHDAVNDDRRSLHAARRSEAVAPDQSGVFHIIGIDQFEFAETCFGIIETDRRPIVGRCSVGLNKIAIDLRRDVLDLRGVLRCYIS